MINTERLERIGAALREAGLDGMFVSLSTSVLLLAGYWPVTGTPLAVATRNGRVVALATEVRNGHIERGLAVALEDLYVDGSPAGAVGKEIYGCGAAFA